MQDTSIAARGGPPADPAGIRWAAPRAIAIAFVIAGIAAAPPPAAAAAPDGPPGTSVVVLEHDGAGQRPERVVRHLGGRITRRLAVVDGFAARVPRSVVTTLRSAGGVRAVVLDGRLRPLSDESTSSLGTSLASVRATIAAGDDASAGAGVDVALVDTGISPVGGLAGRIVDGPDLSADADDAGKRHLDGFGGRHLAGAVAGEDGVARAARMVNVKVADRDGATSLSRLLAGIDWVVRHRQKNGLNIRVLTSAFGADAEGGDYRNDPLAFAVERAWRSGITVVAAAGNGGAETSALDSPAYDPYVLAVGASDSLGTDTPADDVVASFSSRGSAVRPPDVVAPGTGIISARVPGLLLDQLFPGARVGEHGFRGSGTSQPAAVASGAVAALLSARPDLDPDEVKAALRETARPLGDDPRAEGEGLIDVAAARVA
jgi:serine protease AprX